jgi:hypothetical protein
MKLQYIEAQVQQGTGVGVLFDWFGNITIVDSIMINDKTIQSIFGSFFLPEFLPNIKLPFTGSIFFV